ncbi:pseudouridine synthase [Patescibacteria group bacterium]|nr:pseudouridine synthase [Patescibacteria group bacterium]MBU4453384.1 pseudouridine synthase [Patescibacteria group bacterium]MCG2687412.1 pseudouridine synthase [Candidatus Parcubacteria bacterium]
MRLNKYIADCGYCSRRKADELIQKGSVKINGRVASLGDQVNNKDKVSVNGQMLVERGEDIYIALNKPYGVICTMDPEADNTIYDYIKMHERMLYIGRLDVESSGLILLTNNGEVANKITRPSSNHEKEYVVTLNKEITRKFLDSMANGVIIDGTKTKPAKIKKLGDTKFDIVLTEGRNRQIRRMCAVLGYEVTSIRRVRIMNIKLGQLGEGNSRPLTKTERRELLSNLD